jgi:membrane protease YdiL (CAAX protease family)
MLLDRWVQKHWLFWAANILAALAFGAAHLPTLMVLYGTSSLSSISPFVLLEVFLLNGLIGLAAGFWYRRQGVVATTGIHFWTDIIWHVLWPLLF